MSQPRDLVSAGKQAVPEFRVEIRPDRELVVLELHGELCLASAPTVSEHLHGLIASGFERIVLDLRPVTFMDSTGVRLLVETEAGAAAAGFHFAIVIDSGQPSSVLDLVGMPDRPPRVRPEDLRGD
jgi:anti-anti-sigma factor